MSKEEAIRIIKIVLAVAGEFEITVQGEEFTEEKCKEAVDMAVKALEQEPCEDAISRQAVKELYYKDGYIDFRKICELSPVTLQPKRGHWITKRTIMHDGEFYCDVCDNDAPFNKTYCFCPNCGSRMIQEVKNETDN